MFKLCFYVPSSHVELVKEALFVTGAGRYKNYDRCSWQCTGSGQFRPLPGSSPFTGKENETEYVEELKVEMICEDSVIKEAVNTLLIVHPYEEVAYEIYKMITMDEL